MLNGKNEKIFFFYDDCSEIEIHPNSIEHAYLAILNNDLITAGEIFAQNDSPRARWGCVLVSVLKGFLEYFPTFFQLRNFLEIDIDFLLKNEKMDYIEQILGALEIFSSINQETYKFVARVMFANNFLTASHKYMLKSKDVFYNDAELHFLMAKYYAKMHDYEKAENSIDDCLNLIPDYYPAVIMQQEFEEDVVY